MSSKNASPAAPKRRARKQKISCDECYFRNHDLCALDLDAPCSTFRPNSPGGLVPPQQPMLLLRHPGPQAQAA